MIPIIFIKNLFFKFNLTQKKIIKGRLFPNTYNYHHKTEFLHSFTIPSIAHHKHNINIIHTLHTLPFSVLHTPQNPQFSYVSCQNTPSRNFSTLQPQIIFWWHLDSTQNQSKDFLIQTIIIQGQFYLGLLGQESWHQDSLNDFCHKNDLSIPIPHDLTLRYEH